MSRRTGRSPSATAVVTIVHGRRNHLQRQQRFLSTVHPDLSVVVAMNDADTASWRPDADAGGSYPTTVLALDRPDGGLPLAAARNAGAAAALAWGAEVLVFLDVDCLPGPGLVAAYRNAVTAQPRTVWSGPVTYLPEGIRPEGPADLARFDDPHPGRPAPAHGLVAPESDWSLFWSLSFALHAEAWSACGGFDEGYTGYGGEDTDFGQRARRAGLDVAWVGSARAWHQHHPVSSPPVEHAEDIVRNGLRFADTWGWWPMRGWLEELADLGVVRRLGEGYATGGSQVAP